MLSDVYKWSFRSTPINEAFDQNQKGHHLKNMASYIGYVEDLTEADIMGLDIKDLNKKLKQKNISKREQQEIKKQRRKIKMKKYRKDSRMRKATELDKLLEQRSVLLDEFFGLKQEVAYLQRSKAFLIKRMRNSDDDDEYGEFVIVD